MAKRDAACTVSYQAQSPVLAAVLPSNSPGVHTLWLPAIALQMGLVLKPGPQEPWTPYRIFAAFTEAGVPREAFSLYPGEAEAGAAVLEACDRAMIFGGTATVDRYRGNPKVQAHGPGFSKILLGDDVVDRWPEYLDLMVESIYLNSGRGCINCSGVWASRHTREIAEALAERLGPVEALAADRSESRPGRVHGARHGRCRVEADRTRLAGAAALTHSTEKYGPRLVEQGAGQLSAADDHPCAVARSAGRTKGIHVSLCRRRRMPASRNAATNRPDARRHRDYERRIVSPAATNATHIDRLNLGPDPHHEAQLAAAPRRKSVRFPVPQPCAADFPPPRGEG